MRPIARRTAALVAVPALALAGLAATSAPAQAAADPAPSNAAASWLESQLTDGIVHNDQFGFDDIALSADVGFALAAFGGHDATVDQITAAIEPRAHDEWYTYTDGSTTTLYAGSLAKTAAYADAVGADPTSFGGHDLVSMLEGTVSTVPPTTGRVEDVNNAYGDTNTFGQAYAVQVLHAAGSPQAAPALAFLLQQQCSGGWFRLDFSPRAKADQSCDGARRPVADTDATAIALQTMVSLHDDALVPAIDKAEAWLLETQYPNGAWDGRPNSPQPNANSTGLVGSVLADLGDTDQALDGAAWLRGHQLTNVGSCSAFRASDLGAVSYDNAARASLLETPVDAAMQDQIRRATASGLALLPLAQAGTGTPNVLFAPGYVKAGGTTQVGVNDAAPGEPLCAKLGSRSTPGWADPAGDASLKVRVPAKPGTSTVTVANAGGVFGDAELHALGGKKLTVTLRSARVAVGHREVITVTGLAPGEDAQIAIVWPSRAGSGAGQATGGQANSHGVFRYTVTAPNRPGTATVKATGAFRNRKGTTSFVVTR